MNIKWGETGLGNQDRLGYAGSWVPYYSLHIQKSRVLMGSEMQCGSVPIRRICEEGENDTFVQVSDCPLGDRAKP